MQAGEGTEIQTYFYLSCLSILFTVSVVLFYLPDYYQNDINYLALWVRHALFNWYATLQYFKTEQAKKFVVCK